MESKPKLDKNISIQDFKDFYWYREELVNFCRVEGLAKVGSKLELAERIIQYLKTGKKTVKSKGNRPSSRFDWGNEKLSRDTIITDNYKNTENVRSFMVKEIGTQFRFNVKFMNWMKTAQDKTLGDAICRWQELNNEAKSNKSKKDIAPQFEYNTYIRDFMEDNPTIGREVAIACWKMRKAMRGNNKYRKSDLELLRISE